MQNIKQIKAKANDTLFYSIIRWLGPCVLQSCDMLHAYCSLVICILGVAVIWLTSCVSQSCDKFSDLHCQWLVKALFVSFIGNAVFLPQLCMHNYYNINQSLLTSLWNPVKGWSGLSLTTIIRSTQNSHIFKISPYVCQFKKL